MEAGPRRFRPIFLTSLTTFAGLIPLLLEKSTQAQFIIPMAVSLSFGVVFATTITLLFVPISYLMLEKIILKSEGKIYKLLSEQFIEQPIDVVFEFFSKPENLEEITPSRLRFTIITPSPIIMEKGSVIDYYIKILGISVHWQTLITSFVPPYRFVDEQIKGPYSLWHHTHTFSEENGGTMIRDEVRYIVPAGFLGQIMNFIWIKKDLDDIFAYRKEVISEKFFKPLKNFNSTNFNTEVA